MADNLNGVQIVNRIYRWISQGGTVPSHYTPEILGEYIDDCYQDLVARMRQSRQWYALATYDFTITSNPQTFYMPNNCYQRRALIPWDATNNKPIGNPLQRLNPADSVYRWGGGYLILENNQIQFWNVGTSGTVRMFYERSIANLTCGKATAVSATSITLSADPVSDTVGTYKNANDLTGFGTTSLRDDEYNGEKIMIVSATTNGNRQYAIVTDYVGSTRVLSVASWPGGTPTGDSIIYSILPVLPEEFQNLLVYGAVLGLVDTEYKAIAQDRYDRLFLGFSDWLDSEDESTPINVLDTNGDLPSNMNSEDGIVFGINLY